MHWADPVVQKLLPFNQTLQKNETFNTTFADLCHSMSATVAGSFCFLQIYKIRKNINATMVVRPLGTFYTTKLWRITKLVWLGFWNYEVGTDKLKRFQSVETRINFMNNSLIFGITQSKTDNKIMTDESLAEDINDMENLNKIADFITSYLNATYLHN